MKDMVDAICNMCANSDIKQHSIQVQELLISGQRVEFLSMKYLQGRYYRLTREQTLTIPTTLDGTSIRVSPHSLKGCTDIPPAHQSNRKPDP
jgi:hypothetical protein